MISAEKARLIKAIILDIDGVLTDGRVGYGAPDLIKFFHSHLPFTIIMPVFY